MTPGVVVCWSGAGPCFRTLRIPADGLVLGREHASSSDDQISRQHAQLRIVDGALEITDLGSRNGTYLNKWYQNPHEPVRSPFPAVLRTGSTVVAVLADIELYEDLHEEGRVWAAFERAGKDIEAAARAEQNVAIEAGGRTAMALMRRYCDTFGGGERLYQPHVDQPSLEESLAGTRPRVVVLFLSDAALSFRDVPTVTTWLETDVRFVTVMWPGSKSLAMASPEAVARLRERVIRVENPRYDELPYRVHDLVRQHAPDAAIHASVCEGMVLKSIAHGEDWVVSRFADALVAWRAANPAGATLHMRDVVDRIDLPRTTARCVDGTIQSRRRSF